MGVEMWYRGFSLPNSPSNTALAAGLWEWGTLQMAEKLVSCGCTRHTSQTEELKTRDWKTRERIGYGKPIKPKQPTHF